MMSEHERTPEVVAVSGYTSGGDPGANNSRVQPHNRTVYHEGSARPPSAWYPQDKLWGVGRSPTWQRTIIKREMPVSLVRATGIEEMTDENTINRY